MADHTETERSRVEATITRQGDILCTCGKKLAECRDGEVEWKCRCGQHVYINVDILFYRACQTALESNHAIITLMAERRKSAGSPV